MKPSMPFDCDLSQAELIDCFSLCYRLLNYAFSKSFKKISHEIWLNPQRLDTIYAINDKACNNLSISLPRIMRDTSKDHLFSYLDSLQQELKIPVPKKTCRGQLSQLTITQYIPLEQFLYATAVYGRNDHNFQRERFALNEILFDISRYLVIRDSVVNGCPNEKFEQSIHKLYTNKPAAFFKEGYLADLFIVDQVRAQRHKAVTPLFVTTQSSYLSTRSIQGDVKKANLDGLDLIRIA